MKRKHVPLAKQSKRKRREYYASQRKDWGGLNPITRTSPNPRAYNRHKVRRRYNDEPTSGFLFA